MAIPSQQIGQPSSTKSQLLWNISKQLESLTGVLGNVQITPPAANLWTFTPGEISIFPIDSTGYTLYEGGWSQYDDGQTDSTIPFAGTCTFNGVNETSFYLSTNGFLFTADNNYQINGNQQDLFITPGDPLNDGDVQNFWYQNTGDSNKWKTSILVYCGHCCGNPNQETPYSYILNIYKDTQYQYVETVCKTNISGNAGPDNYTINSDTVTQVWQSDLTGSTWTLLGPGSISGGGCPECPTTTTTTTANPGPTPSYTGTINVSTLTPGNEFFNFRILSQDNGQSTSATINWGDDTQQSYSIGPDSYVYFNHTYPSNGEWVVTVTFDNPAQINTLDLDRNGNESPAVVTGYDFRNFNGINQLIVNNNDALHIAATTGLTTLTIFQATNADLESLSLIDGGNITNISANNNNLSVIDLTPATSVHYVNLADNQLVAVDISDSTNITHLDLSNNAMSQAGVDAVLLSLVQNNQNAGYLDLRGPANDAPSQTGSSLVSTLQARAWTVYVNTSSGVQSTLMYSVASNENTAYQGLTYYDVASSIYKLYQVYELPRTVYYTGTLGVNTILWSNPEMTVFNAPAHWGGYSYAGVIFSDVAINRDDNISPSLQTYQIVTSIQNNLINSNPGTVGTISFNYARFKGSNTLSPCDVQWQEYSRFLYYSGTPTLSLGALVADGFTNGWSWYNRNYITQFTGGTSVYQLAWGANGKEVTAITPCTFTPTFTNAKWGYTRQDAIDGVNSFNIQPSAYNPYDPTTDFTFNGCDGIKLVNGYIGDLISGTFWVAYDGMVKQFFVNYYEIASYDRYSAPAVELITPLVTPYQIVVTPDQSYCAGFDSNNTITLYSNFSIITKYTAAYTDAALTTFPTWNWYTMQNNPAGYMYYDKWFYYSTCP